MKKRRIIYIVKYLGVLLLAGIFLVSCKSQNAPLSEQDSQMVKDSVSLMMTNIPKALAAKGPAAWLNYFEDAPGFFMASGGDLIFKDYPSAKSFILTTLVKSISKVNLRWSNIRIDPMTPQLAAIGADFHEDLTAVNGTMMPVDGYFTATAGLGNGKWKLKNLHWSIKALVK